MRWVGSSVPLRTTEGETRLTDLLREKLSPTHLVVEDMSGREFFISFLNEFSYYSHVSLDEQWI